MLTMSNDEISLNTKIFIETVHRYTDIPVEHLFNYIKEYGVKDIAENANIFCATESQRTRLKELFQFKNIYDIINKFGIKSIEFNDSNTVKSYFINYFSNRHDKEYFSVAYLNSSLELIIAKDIFSGTINEARSYPREVIKEAFFHNASSIILAHNHPGGNTQPSMGDIEATKVYFDICKNLNINLIDHLIVTRNNAISLADMGLINKLCYLSNNVPIKELKNIRQRIDEAKTKANKIQSLAKYSLFKDKELIK